MKLIKTGMVFLMVVLFFCVKEAQSFQQQTENKNQVLTFAHPGIINNKASLDYVATTNDKRKLNAYQSVINFIQSNAFPSAFPSIVYAKASASTPTEKQMRKDAILVYAYALKWAKTGAPSDAKQAITILNGWSQNFIKYEFAEGTKPVQAQLEAAWIAPTFAAAAEIIRHYKVNGTTRAAWSVKEIKQFSDFLINLRDHYINPLVKEVEIGKRQNNWGVSAGYAKMAIGVFLDNHTDYEEGKRVIEKLIPVVIKTGGEVHELCARDCHHPQYSMTGLTYAAEIAHIQGDKSIYQAHSERIKTGWEWVQQAFTGNIACRDCSAKKVFPGVEVAAAYYSSPALKGLAQLQSPYGAPSDHTFLGFTTFTHFAIK